MPNAKKPNVLVFFTDQQRHDSTGVHGNPLDITPNFDRMARAGTHLHHFFTCQPVCGPARSCLQTGQYATTTGCWRNGIPLDPDATTLAKEFGRAGYRTGYIGKWHLADRDSLGPVEPAQRGGYEDWLASNVLEFTSDAYQTNLYDNDGHQRALPGYRVDALTDAAIRWIDEKKADPFFLFISYIEPHHQNSRDDYPAPTGYEEAFAGAWTPPDLEALGGTSARHLAGYWGMIKRLDEALGRLQDALKSMDLEDDTIILFVSDHGNHFKTRNAEYKRSCHDASIRVPCAFGGPGFTAGGQLHAMTSLVDLPPTLLDAAGLPVPDSMQGRSIMPLVKRENVEWPEEVLVQISESQTGRAVRTKRWKYSVSVPDEKPFDGKMSASSPSYSEEFLYDLKADPWELNNLIGLKSHQKVADVMRARLIARMEEAGEAPPEIVRAPTRGSGQYAVSDAEARE